MSAFFLYLSLPEIGLLLIAGLKLKEKYLTFAIELLQKNKPALSGKAFETRLLTLL